MYLTGQVAPLCLKPYFQQSERFMYVRQEKRDGGQQGGERERETACANVRSKGVIDRRINVFPMRFQAVHTI